MNLYLTDSSFKVGDNSYPVPTFVNERSVVVEVKLMHLKYALLVRSGAHGAKTWETYERHLYDYFGFLEIGGIE
jgi:integrase/recombinase XerD